MNFPVNIGITRDILVRGRFKCLVDSNVLEVIRNLLSAFEVRIAIAAEAVALTNTALVNMSEPDTCSQRELCRGGIR